MDYKRVLYVGGLDASVDESLLTATFITFGPIRSVEIPKENIVSAEAPLPHTLFNLPYELQKNSVPASQSEGLKKSLLKPRGFGFVEFEDPDDAAAAKDNMDGFKLQNRYLKVDIAKRENIKIGSKRPTLNEMSEWYQKKIKEDGFADEKDMEEFERTANRL